MDKGLQHYIFMYVYIHCLIEYQGWSVNPIRSRLFYCVKVQEGVFRDPLKSQEPLKVAQRNFSHLQHNLRSTRIHKEIFSNDNGKIRTHVKISPYILIAQ